MVVWQYPHGPLHGTRAPRVKLAPPAARKPLGSWRARLNLRLFYGCLASRAVDERKIFTTPRHAKRMSLTQRPAALVELQLPSWRWILNAHVPTMSQTEILECRAIGAYGDLPTAGGAFKISATRMRMNGAHGVH